MDDGREKCVRNWQRNREAEEEDKVEVAPGVTVTSLRRISVSLLARPEDSQSGVGCADREACSPESTVL